MFLSLSIAHFRAFLKMNHTISRGLVRTSAVSVGGGSSGMSMGYQSAVPPMMPQQPVQPNPSQSMMQQAMFGAQGALGEQLVPYGCTRS